MADAGWLELADWLERRGTLEPWRLEPEGESVSEFRRPIRVVVR